MLIPQGVPDHEVSEANSEVWKCGKKGRCQWAQCDISIDAVIDLFDRNSMDSLLIVGDQKVRTHPAKEKNEQESTRQPKYISLWFFQSFRNLSSRIA